MTATITIQPGQPGMGMEYDVHRPLPYPFHIDATTGDCTRGRGTVEDGQDQVCAGRPWRLIGFQAGNMQEIALTFADFAQDPQKALGMVPVFIDGQSIFALGVPVTDISDHRTSPPTPEALPVRTWNHRRKGRISGAIVSDDGEFVDIRLVGDQTLTYLSVSADPVHDDGDVITVRRSFLTEVSA